MTTPPTAERPTGAASSTAKNGTAKSGTAKDSTARNGTAKSGRSDKPAGNAMSTAGKRAAGRGAPPGAPTTRSAAGGRPPGTDAGGDAQEAARLIRLLTPREALALAHLAAGRDLIRTAAALGVTPATARNHQHRAMRKLGTRTRAELAPFAALLNDLHPAAPAPERPYPLRTPPRRWEPCALR
ncbi:helix-turn-helix domain-containing protein, partial [Kitasatospora sp. NPDC004240]